MRKNYNDDERSSYVGVPHEDPLLQASSEETKKYNKLQWGIASPWKLIVLNGYTDQENNAWLSRIYDLLHNLDELADLLRFELEHKSWLNAYLLASGMNQITEDYLRADPYRLGKAAKYAGELPPPVGPLIAAGILASVDIWTKLREFRQAFRKTKAWQHKLAQLVDVLAEIMMHSNSTGQASRITSLESVYSLLADLPQLPADLRNEIIRLPSCFRSFDQKPEDLRRIVDEFTIHWPERDRPISVIGIRTSGSYLAPLYAAILRDRGYQQVSNFTLRPGAPMTIEDRSELRKLVDTKGLALICDDPPISGGTLTKSTRLMEHSGIEPGNIVLLLQLFGDSSSLPTSLQKYPSVLMSWQNWTIHQQLDPKMVKKLLEEACSSSIRILEVKPLPNVDGIEDRQHVHALYRVKLENPATSQTVTRLVQLKGVGLGYFGEHALAVAQRLPNYSPQIIALQDGLLLQEVPLPAQPLIASMVAEDGKWIEQMVRYILERNHQLPTGGDRSLHLFGRNAVWEVASNLLSNVFGRGWMFIRIPVIDPYVKTVLKTGHPSVIDGEMALRSWYIEDKTEYTLVKANLAERDFSHMDLFSYDPVYDLSDLALEVNQEISSYDLRYSYEALSTEQISPERWMLYKLVHLWDLHRQNPASADLVSRRMARVVQEYFSEIYFHKILPETSGPLCVFDLDGVLETNQLGIPSLTPTSARSLYALTRHGYRIILATGRSLEEVMERCDAYKLAGGVAEYGAVLYDHLSGKVLPMLTEDERGELYAIRARLSNKPGIYLDPGYRYAVRAYRLDTDGKHRGLDSESISGILSETGLSDRVYAIAGNFQTDFMVKRINKSVGLKEWMANFDASYVPSSSQSNRVQHVALAVGDSPADLPMLYLAKLAYAPSHASQEVKQGGIQITRKPYQRGLEQAVTALLGHRPGACSICQPTAHIWSTAFMQEILAVQENGRLNMVWQAIRLFLRKAQMIHGSK